jgi:lysophospholipase L1-like esterase
MATISAGQNGSVTLLAGQYASFLTGASGIATIASGRFTGTKQLILPNDRIGPYEETTTISLTAYTDVTYTINISTTDLTSKLLASPKGMIGGQSDGSGGAIRIGRVQAKGRFVLIGHSYIAYGVDTSTQPNGMTSMSHVAHANLAMGGQFAVMVSYAVGGKTIEQVTAEQVPSALVQLANGLVDCCWVSDGINNLNVTLPNYESLDAMIAAKKAQLDLLTSFPLVVVDNMGPLDDAARTANPSSAFQALPRQQEIPVYNAMLSQLCAKYPNVVYNDIYTPLVDSASATGSALTGFLWDTDGVHWRSKAAQRVGKATAEMLGRNVYFTGPWSIIETLSLPNFTGTGGTFTNTSGSGAMTQTDAIPAGFNVEVVTGDGQVTGTRVKNASGSNTLGDRYRLAITSTAGTVVRFQLANPSAFVGKGTPDIGEYLLGFSGFKVLNGSAAHRRVSLSLSRNNGVNGNSGALNKPAAGESPSITMPSVDWGGVQVTNPTPVITAATAQINLVWTVELAASGSVTVEFFGMKIQRAFPA